MSGNTGTKIKFSKCIKVKSDRLHSINHSVKWMCEK